MAKNSNIRKTEISNNNKQNALILSVLLLITFIVFWNSRTFGFVWDDNEYIVNNPFITSLSFQNVKNIFTSFYAANYHPLTTLSWAVEYHLWGTNPEGFHISNILFHVINVFLVFSFVQLLIKDIRVTTFTTALFALHPMHVESIVWISERKDLLYTLFYISSLLCYVKFLEIKKKRLFAFSFLFFVLSCLSKSAAVTLPLVLILIDYYKDNFTIKTILQKIPFLAASILFGILAILSQKSVSAFNVTILDYTIWNRFLLLCYSVYYYLFAFIFPLKLSALHFYPKDQSALTFEYYLAPLILLMVFFTILYFKKYRKELIFGFAFYLFSISLVIQFFPMGSAIVSERYSYIPYIGLSIMIARIILCEIDSRKKTVLYVYIMAGIIVLLFAVKAHNRAKIWLNAETLFTDIVDKNQDAYYAYWFRSTARLNTDDYENCISDCTMGLSLNPDYTQFYSVRGLALLHLKNYKEAINDFSIFLKYKPTDGDILFQRGKARRELHDYLGTIRDFERALQLNPKLRTAIVYVDLSNLKIAINDFKGSQNNLDKALSIDPANTEALFNKGVNCFNVKQYKESIECFDKLIQINPRDNEAFYNRGIVKATIGDKDGACRDYKLAAGLGNSVASETAANCK